MKLPRLWSRTVAAHDCLYPIFYGRALRRKLSREYVACMIKVRKVATRKGFEFCASCAAPVRNRRKENWCHGCGKYICARCADTKDHWSTGRHGLLINVK